MVIPHLLKADPHHELIMPEDIPCWAVKNNNVHMDIEAKHKETAIFLLKEQLKKRC